MPPTHGFAILTSMDARLDPAKYAGLSEGDAHVIRNAGGRATDDAIRSLVISYKLLGTKEWLAIHHTNCGMEFFTNDVMGGLLESSLETAALGAEGFYDVGEGPGSSVGRDIDWLTISDQAVSVLDDVRRIREHPLVPSRIPVYGYVYDVSSGKLIGIPEATEVGKASYGIVGNGPTLRCRGPVAGSSAAHPGGLTRRCRVAPARCSRLPSAHRRPLTPPAPRRSARS